MVDSAAPSHRQIQAVHISEHDLERYYLGMVSDPNELATLEEHLLSCPACVQWAEASDDYIDHLRAAIVKGGFDLAID